MQYIPYIFYGLLAIGVLYFLIAKMRIKRNGTEADAVVSRVERQESRNDDGSYSTMETYYVAYKNDSGQTVEASLMAPPMGLREGSRVKIKYTPEKPKLAVVSQVIEK